MTLQVSTKFGSDGSGVELSWDHAGLVWHGKQPKAGNGKKKMEMEVENGPKMDRGKNGKKMAKNGF